MEQGGVVLARDAEVAALHIGGEGHVGGAVDAALRVAGVVEFVAVDDDAAGGDFRERGEALAHGAGEEEGVEDALVGEVGEPAEAVEVEDHELHAALVGLRHAEPVGGEVDEVVALREAVVAEVADLVARTEQAVAELHEALRGAAQGGAGDANPEGGVVKAVLRGQAVGAEVEDLTDDGAGAVGDREVFHVVGGTEGAADLEGDVGLFGLGVVLDFGDGHLRALGADDGEGIIAHLEHGAVGGAAAGGDEVPGQGEAAAVEACGGERGEDLFFEAGHACDELGVAEGGAVAEGCEGGGGGNRRAGRVCQVAEGDEVVGRLVEDDAGPDEEDFGGGVGLLRVELDPVGDPGERAVGCDLEPEDGCIGGERGGEVVLGGHGRDVEVGKEGHEGRADGVAVEAAEEVGVHVGAGEARGDGGGAEGEVVAGDRGGVGLEVEVGGPGEGAVGGVERVAIAAWCGCDGACVA